MSKDGRSLYIGYLNGILLKLSTKNSNFKRYPEIIYESGIGTLGLMPDDSSIFISSRFGKLKQINT